MQTQQVANQNIPLSQKHTSRNASFELARIIAMIFIIAHHFQFHGGWSLPTDNVNGVCLVITNALFLPAVNVFVMISAYFMCTKTQIPWKKLAKLWLTVFFYSIILFTAFTAAGVYKFDLFSFLQALFPILMNRYWFFSAYCLMILMSPFFNMLIAKLNKAQFSLICLLIIVLASLQDASAFVILPLEKGHNGVWLCLLYFIAAYIRKYDISLNNVVWAIGLLGFIALVAVSFFTGGHYNSINTVLMSIFIFLTAKKFTIKNKPLSKIICFVSSLTFGIYIIHDSPEIEKFMYEQIFHSSKFISSKYAFLIYIGFVLATFCVCALIEWIRKIGFDAICKISKKLFGERIEKVKNRAKKLITDVADKINATDKTGAAFDMSYANALSQQKIERAEVVYDAPERKLSPSNFEDAEKNNDKS